jgi:hypothetical protein
MNSFEWLNQRRAWVLSRKQSGKDPIGFHPPTGAASPAWNNSVGYFTFLSGTPATGVPTVIRLNTTDSSVNLDQAQITWDVEFEDQPAFGRTFTLKPRATIGDTLVEAEAVLPDGRRVFGRQYVHFRPSSGGQEFTADGNTAALYHLNAIDTLSRQIPDDSGHGYKLIVSSGFPDLIENNSWMATANPSSAFQAARFGAIGDEIASLVTIPDSVLRPAGSDGFTMEFRMYVKRLPGNRSLLYLFRLAEGEPGTGDVNEWRVGYDTSVAPFPQIDGPGHQVILPSDSAADGKDWEHLMTPNTWHLIKITAANNPGAGCQPGYTGFDTKVYIDDMNIAAASLTTCAYIDPNAAWVLSMGDFVGCIDEMRISNVVR